MKNFIDYKWKYIFLTYYFYVLLEYYPQSSLLIYLNIEKEKISPVFRGILIALKRSGRPKKIPQKITNSF